jgi:putative acetyltransferase
VPGAADRHFGVYLRREQAGDEAAIAAVHAAAFARADAPRVEPPEVALVALLRASDAWIPALSIVAFADEQIVGHVVCSRATIADSFAVLGLGPLGVHPDYQDARFGSALMHAIIGAADSLDEPLIVLLGNPAYYERFGFEPAADHRIGAPDDSYGEHFQVRHLTSATGAERGPFRYADAFGWVS